MLPGYLLGMTFLLVVFLANAAPVGDAPPPLMDAPMSDPADGEPDPVVPEDRAAPDEVLPQPDETSRWAPGLPDDPRPAFEEAPGTGAVELHGTPHARAAGIPLAAVGVSAGALVPSLVGAGVLVAAAGIGAAALAGTGAPVITLLVAVGAGFALLPLLIGAGAGAGLLIVAADDTPADWISLASLISVLVAVGVMLAVTVALAGVLILGVAGGGGGISIPDLHGCGSGASGCRSGSSAGEPGGVAAPDVSVHVAVLTPVALSGLGAAAGGLGAFAFAQGGGPGSLIDDDQIPLLVAAGAGAGLVAGAALGGILGGAGAAMTVE